MPATGRYSRTYSLNRKSINLGRCVKHEFVRHFSLKQILNNNFNRNGSALNDSPSKLALQSDTIITACNSHLNLSNIPQAPPLPSILNKKLSSDILKSTDFSKEIIKHTSSTTPSGTDLSQSLILRPSQINNTVSMIKKSSVNTNLRNRRRTPITPDILALTKLRRPEHIKSSIVQRIEELKQASLNNSQISNEKSAVNSQLSIICEYKNNIHERSWLNEQSQLNSSIRFLNTNNYLQLNNRLFLIRSIEFLDDTNVKFYAQEKMKTNSFLTRSFKQITLLTILIITTLRFTENLFLNLSMPSVKILLNFVYIFLLITIVLILLTNQK